MGTNRLKVQIAVSMQLQMALHDPTQGIRVLCSKTISHFLKQYIYILTLNAHRLALAVLCVSMTLHPSFTFLFVCKGQLI